MEKVSIEILRSIIPDREEVNKATDDQIAIMVFNYCNKLRFEIAQLKKKANGVK